MTSTTNRPGQAIALTYDDANRLSQKSYVGTGDAITYAYDNANQLTGVVSAVTSGNSSLAFAYDSAGRLTNETQTVGQAPSLAVGYEFFADGRRKKLTYPDSTHITYEYNTKGWLTAIKDGGTNSIVTYDYDDAGRRTKRTLENNTFTVYDYDDADQLSAISHQQSAGGFTNLISRYEYAYDAAGNRTQMVRTAVSAVRSESYHYDAQDQLTGVTYKTGGATDRIVSYFYDAAGNRTNLIEKIGNATNTTSYAANSDNQLTNAVATRQGLTVTGYVQPGTSSNKWYASVARAGGQQSAVSSQNGTFAIPGVPVTGGANALTVTVTDVSGNIATQIVNVTVASAATVLGYDANGNQTNDAVWGFSYDRENRLLFATSASSAVSYSYDALGRLVERRTSGTSATTNRLYYAGWQLIAEYNGAGALQRKYVCGPGIDEPIRMTAGSAKYYYHADGLGSITEMSDGSGLKAESYSYDVYGTPTIYNASGIVTNASTVGNRLLFTSRDRDLDTGWYNYRHRYYSASLGRFVQPDPVGLEGGHLNLYKCTANNPTTLVDPFGLAERTSSFWTLWGNSLNNTADAVATSFGALIYDATHLTWSSDIYGDSASLLWSTETPAAPEATPYVAAGLGISAAATSVAVLSECPAAARKVGKEIHFDGPKWNYKNPQTGRIAQIRWKTTPLLRLDYHAIPGSNGKPVLHLNVGPGEGKNSIHIPIWK